jgi:hypothetical protein
VNRCRSALAVLFGFVAFAGCGSRPGYWNTVPGATSSVGLENAVALVDDADHRVVLLSMQATTAAGMALAPARSVPIGHEVTTVVASPDGVHLFALAAGDWPPQTATDQLPSLTVIDTTNLSSTWIPSANTQTYKLTQPFPTLAIDPEGHYAIAYQGSAQSSVFVDNPNELVIFDLTKPYSDSSGPTPNPVVRTIQSFGGTPQRLTFTPPLLVNPSAPSRRLLVIETQIDVTLLDLDNAFPTASVPARPEITVGLTTGTTAMTVTPAAVVVDSFDPNSASDARIAVRTSNDTQVYTIAFGPPNAGDLNDFAPTLNLTDVGGTPSDMAFVHTDAGLRLATLVPTLSTAVLVEPDTSLTTPVALPSGYANLSLVTSQVTTGGASSGTTTDVALLWNGAGTASGVALWTLNNTVGQPYDSIQVLDVSQAVSGVDDVPNTSLKVLETANGNDQFFVLDLAGRTVSPLGTEGQVTLSIAPDGQRVWVYAPGGTQLAAVDFSNLSPTQLLTDLPIDAVYDIACLGSGGSRALLAIHLAGTVGATIFNAKDPQSIPPLSASGLLFQEAP